MIHPFLLAVRVVQRPTGTEWGALMAISTIAVIPLIIIFQAPNRWLNQRRGQELKLMKSP